METPLFTKVPDMSAGENTITSGINSNPYCMQLLNKLEGYKTRIKEMHWAGLDGKNLVYHRFMDDVAGVVSGYEDNVAEDLQALYGNITVGTLAPILPEAKELLPLLQAIKADANDVEMRYKNDIMYAGLININEGFISEINKLIYLAKFMC